MKQATVFLSDRDGERFLPRNEAHLGLEDRAALFADGVYEVIRFYGGRPFRLEAHTRRLASSLDSVRIAHPKLLTRVEALSLELVRRNGLGDCAVYWQISRGEAPRHHAFPADTAPTCFALCQAAPPLVHGEPDLLRASLTVDERWHRCSIKSLMLLPNILAHNEALDAGSDVAIFMRGEVVTESSSANIAIVRRGELWTHPASRWVLDGVTRTVILELAREMKLPVVEEPFRRIDLCTADEILLCGTRSHLASITHIDGREVCKDAPGPLARQLHDALLDRIASECNSPSVT